MAEGKAVNNAEQGGAPHDDNGIDIVYRSVESGDAEALFGLSSLVRWSHRLDDWRMLLSVGNGVVAVAGRQVVGVTLYWLQGDTHATIGCVIVSPEWQGRRIGNTLMMRALIACGTRTVSLNATPEGAGLYARLGFVDQGFVAQHQAVVSSVPTVAVDAPCLLRPMTTADHDAVVALHSFSSGLDRRAILPAYLAIAQGVVLERDGQLVGFSLFRSSGRGFAIGPVVAPGLNDAKALIAYWIAKHNGQFLRIDLPEDPVLCDWLVGLGLPRVDRLRLMVRGAPAVRSAAPRMFALINQALS